MLAVVMLAIPVGKVVRAAAPRTTGASPPAVIMTTFVVRFVNRAYSYDPWVRVATVPAAFRRPVVRWCRRQVMAFSMASSMIRFRHSWHVLSLDFLHSLPIVRWNLLASQNDVVQSVSFQCQSPVPVLILLQLKSIQLLLVPEFLLVKM